MPRPDLELDIPPLLTASVLLVTGRATVQGPCFATTTRRQARRRFRDLAATLIIREIQQCMARTLAQCDGPAKIMVRVTCTPDGHRVELASEGRAPRLVLQSLYDALGSVAKLPVSNGEVVFEIVLTAVPSA